ncbi:acetylornithine deacetylase [soil metagenome]
MSDHLNETMLLLGDLVGFPTVTSESNLDLIEYVIGLLRPLGADLRITYDETGTKANLFATIGPTIDGGVVLSGHSDVVPAEEPDWTGAPFVAMRRHQNIYGRGTADMKGFVACALAMAPQMAATDLLRPIHIAITFDEEKGCRGMPHLLSDLAHNGPKPAAAIVGEPTSMEIVTAHKGCHEYTTTITGLEGHGSAPDSAVNAVQIAARYVSELMSLGSELVERTPTDSPYEPPHSTVSVGTIRGGAARNVVAGECMFEWEMRPVNRSDADFVRERLDALEATLVEEMRSVSPSASIVTITEGTVGGLEADDDSQALRLTQQLLGTSLSTTAAFGTEAGLYQEAGIPAVVCGPGSIDVAHRPDEHVSLEQLGRCLDMMEQLRRRLAKE